MTTNAARLLGFEPAGAIKSGLAADSSPRLRTPRQHHTLKQVSFVMKNGKVFKIK